jgi:hypothetical protein
MPIQTFKVGVRAGTDGFYIALEGPGGYYSSAGPFVSPIGTCEIKLKISERKMHNVAKRQRRSSRRQEDSIAERLGGRRQPGSGAIEGVKGDVKVEGKYRIEAKHTKQKSYRVTREELNKIRGECEGTETPLFVIDFVDPSTGRSPDRWVLMPFHRFEQMDEQADDAADIYTGPDETEG